MAKKNKSEFMRLPSKQGPERKHHCHEHRNVMTPVKVFGKKGTYFTCKEGCRLRQGDTDLR